MHFSIPTIFSLLLAASTFPSTFASPLPNLDGSSAVLISAEDSALDARDTGTCQNPGPQTLASTARCVIQNIGNGVSAAQYKLTQNDVMALTNGIWKVVANAPSGADARVFSQKVGDAGNQLAEVTMSLRNSATDWQTLGEKITWGGVFDAVKLSAQNAADAGKWRNYYWVQSLSGETLAVILVIVSNGL